MLIRISARSRQQEKPGRTHNHTASPQGAAGSAGGLRPVSEDREAVFGAAYRRREPSPDAARQQSPFARGGGASPGGGSSATAVSRSTRSSLDSSRKGSVDGVAARSFSGTSEEGSASPGSTAANRGSLSTTDGSSPPERRKPTLWVLIEIQDSGVGISEASLKTLFQPFAQISNKAGAKNTGTGLGERPPVALGLPPSSLRRACLAPGGSSSFVTPHCRCTGLVITKALIERMNGSIMVSSTEGAATLMKSPSSDSDDSMSGRAM